MKQKTAGQISLELLRSGLPDHTAYEQTPEMLKDFDNQMFTCIKRGMEQYEGDFYIVIVTKKEPLMLNVLRNYWIPTGACPTPDFDQAVYKWHRKDEHLEYIWTIPARDICEYFYANPLLIEPDERILLQHICDYYDGTLLRIAKRLNGEVDDKPRIILS
jgi:hypothetical protein